MDSSDSDHDLERNRQSMFNAVLVKRKKGREEDRCSQVQGYLDEGVDINAVDEDGNTLLHIAVRKGFEKVVQFLLGKRGWIDVENNQGDTAMSLAEKLGQREIARIMKDYEGYPSGPIASTSEAQIFDNPGYHSGLVLSTSSRKRTADFGLVESIKKLKLERADETQHTPCSGPTSTSFEKDHRCNGSNEETIRNLRWDTKKTYAASGAKHALHGTIYQLKHLMLTVNRAWKMGYRFRLATEVDAAEKFDDLVFEYEDSRGRRVHRLVQMKHKQDDTKLIKVSDLLAEDAGEFSVKKYFTSWRKIKKHADFAASESKCFILCTNIGLDVQELKDEQIGVIRVEESDDFLRVVEALEQPPRFKLRPTMESKLYAVLKSASELHQLAKTLAKCVRDSDTLTLKTDIFKRYHMALAEEVLDRRNRRKFSDTFIRKSGLSPTAGQFREIFFTYVKQFPFNKKSSEQQIWNDLGKKLLAVSESFGKSKTGVQQTQLNMLPDDHITDKEIEDFFDEFVLAANQPNEEELGETIKREFGEYSQFNLLNTNFVRDSFQNVLLNWFKDKQGVYLVRDDAKKFFDEIEREISSLITVGLNLPYPAKLKKFDVQFKSEITGLRSFLAFSNLTENSVWQLVSLEDTLLTSLRIYQTLDQMEEYKKHDSHIFIELKNLLLPNIRSQVFRAFQSSGSQRLLIIDCGLDSSRQDIDHLRKNLHEVMTKLNKKKISGKRVILLLPEKDARIIQLEQVNKISYEAEGEISIDNIATATQRKLLGRKVIQFQGRQLKTSFKQLLAIDNFDNVIGEKLGDYRRIISPKTLVELIHNKELLIGGESRGLGEIAEYYIPRSIQYRIVIKDGLLADSKITDIFAVSGIDEKTLRKIFINEIGIEKWRSQSNYVLPNTYIILENGLETEHFGSLCQKYPNHNIHWLQRESRKFVWMRSFGNIGHLIKYREETGSNDDVKHRLFPLNEEQLAEYDERRKIVIISDTAGMEKKKRSFTSNDIDGAVDFLVDKLHPDLEREAVSLFKTIVKVQRNAALLFDGFDEISPDYKETGIALLQALAKLEVKQLFVATRPHTSKALEVRLGVFSYTLQPFSTANQMEFLTKFWNRGSTAQDSVSCSFAKEEPLQKHAQNVMSLLAESIDSSMREFTGVPLQTRMVAEVFPFDESEVPKTITIIEMYRKFVDKKYDIYCTEKKRADLTIPAVKSSSICERNRFSMKHQRFALNLLFDKTIVVKLLSTQGDDFNDTWEDIIDDQERTGIVTAESDGQVRFIHRTFAEYFAAIFLFKMLQRDGCDQSVRELFVGEIFVKREYQVIRAFLNCLLAGENAPRYRESWKFDLSEHRNPEGETAYHVAARERHDKIAKFISTSVRQNHGVPFSNINCLTTGKDRKTPLMVAVEVMNNLDVVRCFIDAGADVHYIDTSIDKKTALHVSVQTPMNIDVVNYLLKNGADIHSQTKMGSTPLHKAARSGHLDLVKYLANKGTDINFKTHHCTTPLHDAVTSGNSDMVEYLVEMGADINSQDTFGDTPLHVAASYGHPDLVKFLAEKGVDINTHGRDGLTALHHAVRSGDPDLVKYLADKGADINSQNEYGQTPLHYVVDSRNTHLVKYLVEIGADMNLKTKWGHTSLHRAVTCGKPELAIYLAERGADIHSRDECGWTVFHGAINSGNIDLVEYLVLRGADINSQTKDGRTPLHTAAVSHSHLLKYLVDKGADLNAQTKEGKTALHCATCHGDSDSVKYLSEKGAIVNSQTEDGNTPLHDAVNSYNVELVKYLVEKGAKINSKNKDGKTPFHGAVHRFKADLMKYLVEKGADINSQAKNGRTPLLDAIQSRESDLVKYLAERGADMSSQTKDGQGPLHHAVLCDKLDLVNYLTEKGADINSRTNDGSTPLHYAVQFCDLDMVKELANNGADINSRAESGDTPLHYAATRGDLDMAKYLVENGADIHFRTGNGSTPLHCAACNGSLDLVKYLLEKGADIHARTEDDSTSLHHAAKHDHPDLAKYLAEGGVNIDARTKDGYTTVHYAARTGNLDLVEYLVGKNAGINSHTKKGYTPIHDAIRYRKSDLAWFLVEKGADINTKTKYGYTPLHDAVRFNFRDLTKFLTDRGADINSQTIHGYTPLTDAVSLGNSYLMEYLTEKGANVHFQFEDGRTPLHYAASRGSLDLVKYLADKGANIRSKTKDGETPLHFAAGTGNLDLVKYLTENGAEVNSRTKDGNPPAHAAAKYGHYDVVRYLAKKGEDTDS